MVGTFGYFRAFRAVGLYVILLLAVPARLSAQDTKEVDGKTYSAYQASHFKPHRGLFYSLYASPVVTVDPLGFGGTSTYGLGIGVRLNLWESKTPPGKYSGLKMTGIYTAVAYEYYPQQYDKSHISLWFRLKTIIPLAARADIVYSKGYGLQGITYRYAVGIEIMKMTLFFCGETGGPWFTDLGTHPKVESPYANAGSILLIIPVYERKDK